ncbi:ribonuclease H-like domain-containing protein [Hathewaya massiliensis]|uniref:ribonuclease H-like domain-containing protein n=1 Tax=Hathewaya massiliensis TaxID=1964382 RepID=UPI00115BD5B1|nr:ribonuclease H-like domain-containing protein [Hathewaya massiliensis]
MICRTKRIKIENIKVEQVLEFEGKTNIYEKAVFLDLEHYVYKHPICIGVFGACIYDKKKKSLIFTQYMIENNEDASKIIYKVCKYLKHAKGKLKKQYLVTFSGNNDCTVIDYLFKEKNIALDVRKYFKEIDLQKNYEKTKKEGIGLKNLEKIFNIERKGENISGMNLAKTISKIITSEEYFHNMPKEKIEKILIYNEQDVVNLFYILTRWNKYIF